MKKAKKTLAVALTFAMTVVMVPQSALAAKKQVKLNKKSVSVAVGKTVKVKLKNNKKKVKWTVVSGKKNVALSKKGKTGVTVKGKRVGKAKVQAKIGKKKYVCTVTVTNKNKAQTTAAKKTAAPGNTTGTTVGKNTGSTAAKPTATPTPTPTSTPTPTPTANPTVTLSADAQALKKIIEEQKKAGATVSEDLQDKDQYSWDDEGTLISITWNKVGLAGKLDLGSFASLKSVSFNNNAITELDVTKCTKLQKLLCNGNQLTKLDVTKCPELINLQCNKNQLSALDVTQCATLETLWCNRNQITSLDMSKSTELVNLYCDRNSLTELDLTNCTKLETVEADEGVTITGYTPAE